MKTSTALLIFGWILLVLTWIIRWSINIQQEENSEWRRLYFIFLVCAMGSFIGSIIVNIFYQS